MTQSGARCRQLRSTAPAEGH
uniref:Uncharacterized protein n=1 Tax=Anguilla anguilla TaxID=7936 RepID=A0A0E9RHR8_ANGAN